MIVYTIKDNKIISIKNVDNTYELQANEYSSNTWYLKPFFNGSAVVESITQAEIDERTEQEAEAEAERVVIKRTTDGQRFLNQIGTKVKRAYDKGDITQVQFKNIRSSVKDVLIPLTMGDWDLAQDNINAVSRPSGQLGVLYDYIKNEIDTYVTNNY